MADAVPPCPLSWTPSPLDHTMHETNQTTMRLRARSVSSALLHTHDLVEAVVFVAWLEMSEFTVCLGVK